ncbi:flavin reductase family protein [Sinosporangium album]|uniref:flavin reductase family protein n=1 Tax=Sinosporangium album TaxID=504805 RepID=UPI0015A39B9C|nr:flavin reductase family protein [Sinosporangium album]
MRPVSARDPLTRPAPLDFRKALGRYATGVVAVTGLVGGAPVALVVNSFTSVSLDPPLVSFCVAHTSRTWPRLREAARLGVNILGEHQRAVAVRLAATDGDRFHGVPWTAAPSGPSELAGPPVLDGVIGRLECSIAAEHPAGDHDIVVAHVHLVDACATGRPLVFYGGRYGGFAEFTGSDAPPSPAEERSPV